MLTATGDFRQRGGASLPVLFACPCNPSEELGGQRQGVVEGHDVADLFSVRCFADVEGDDRLEGVGVLSFGNLHGMKRAEALVF
jgi:hypothetical protein